MKKLLYILGIVSVNITLFGMLSKMNHWPGAGLMILLGILVFTFGFLPAAVYNSYKGSGSKNKALYISGFITAFVILLGSAFKIQHLPGASLILLISVPLPFVLFLPIYIYFHNKEQSKTNSNFLGVMLLLIYIAVYSALLSINVSRNILASFESYNYEFTSLNDIYEVKNTAMYSAILSSENEKFKPIVNDLKIKSDELCDFIDDHKVDFLNSSEDNRMAVTRSKSGGKVTIDFANIFRKDQICTPSISKGDDFLSMKKKLDSYHEYLNNILKNQNLKTPMVDSLLNTNDIKSLYSDNTVSWGTELFSSKYIVSLLANFSLIQSNIRKAEEEVLSQISSVN